MIKEILGRLRSSRKETRPLLLPSLAIVQTEEQKAIMQIVYFLKKVLGENWREELDA